MNLTNASWNEDNGVTVQTIGDTLDYWRTKYDWRKEEALLNAMPQYHCEIDCGHFGTINVHFVHATASQGTSIPLLFLHGWPGSFAEVRKILPLLTKAGFDVVAPSLPGYGFSSYPEMAGFKHEHTAETMLRLMGVLGYQSFCVQGGDWGSDIARTMGIRYPESVKAVHLNFVGRAMRTLNSPLTHASVHNA